METPNQPSPLEIQEWQLDQDAAGKLPDLPWAAFISSLFSNTQSTSGIFKRKIVHGYTFCLITDKRAGKASVVSLKTGDKSPHLVAEWKRHSYHETESLGPRRLCKQILLLLHPGSNPSVLSILHEFIASFLKDIEASCSGHSLSLMLW